jgi:hypothetical protein
MREAGGKNSVGGKLLGEKGLGTKMGQSKANTGERGAKID